jgi:hypothetical protein
MLFWSKIALFLTYIIIEIVASSVKTSTGESVCTYRLATRLDIPNIAACNVKSLPENYTPEYYRRTLGKFVYGYIYIYMYICIYVYVFTYMFIHLCTYSSMISGVYTTITD